MAICVIIPAYNAVSTLPAVVHEVIQAGMPVLVVDDGSNDGTAASVAGLPVNLLRHRENRGKGAALRTGFSWALQHGFVGAITLDADGQHEPTAIPLLAETALREGWDVLLASRFVQFQQMAGLRRHWNRFGAWCMKKRTGFDIDDSQSGFRYYSARLLRTITLVNDGYDLEMEILIKAWKAGMTIGSIPVPARVADGRATSHFRPVRDTWNICMTFLRYM
ncbi:glycosyltransferase family 2 protein [Geomobilimonas luticola]|uniref:Glycosyltransferase family 2 protein n=1 Tax=Geomobilimonas luticola TaxID=1114878 RepID=A0ABS5SCP6_9BACT|nr:glycosyltransferase family 2 protein [Geomobilimonas luticola]